MENTIEIIESHIKILKAELRTLNAKWEENDIKREHDKLTDSSWAWSKEEADINWHKSDECTIQIQRLETIIWDIKKANNIPA